jgi:2-polyprenyl-3-methyl-5-hydroxy-6-metoxy-1,4-benzoquinol methylase
MATATGPRANPERIFNMINAHQQTAALQAGIDLGVFTAIADGARTAAAIAKEVQASERGVRILSDYLTIHGILTKDASGYGLTQDAAVFLNRHSPGYLGGMTGFLASKAVVENFAALTKAVRTGKSSGREGDNTKPNDEMWVPFAKSMAALVTPSAMFLAQLLGMTDKKSCKILDVAAGHGMYGITLAKQNPNARVAALDWPNVLSVAKENAEKAGVAAQMEYRPGSAFEADMGEGYDYVLLTNIFHHFQPATCEKLMKRVHEVLKPGGKAVTLEFVPNEDRVTPPTAAGFSLVMLATTDTGDAYTLAEYEKMFRNAGFAKTSLHPVPEMPQQMLVSEK